MHTGVPTKSCKSATTLNRALATPLPMSRYCLSSLELTLSHHAFLRDLSLSSVFRETPGVLIFERFASIASRIAAVPSGTDMIASSRVLASLYHTFYAHTSFLSMCLSSQPTFNLCVWYHSKQRSQGFWIGSLITGLD